MKPTSIIILALAAAGAAGLLMFLQKSSAETQQELAKQQAEAEAAQFKAANPHIVGYLKMTPQEWRRIGDDVSARLKKGDF